MRRLSDEEPDASDAAEPERGDDGSVRIATDGGQEAEAEEAEDEEQAEAGEAEAEEEGEEAETEAEEEEAEAEEEEAETEEEGEAEEETEEGAEGEELEIQEGGVEAEEEEAEEEGEAEEEEAEAEEEEEAEEPEAEAEEEEEEEEEGATVLHLDLEGLFLDLLGLEVDLNEVVLDITAVPGENRLLGNLLSSVAGLLDPGGLLGGLLPGGGSLGDVLPESGALGWLTGKLTAIPRWVKGKLAGAWNRLRSGLSNLSPDIAGRAREYATNVLNNIPLEKLVATAVQTLVEQLIRQLEERGGEATDAAAEEISDTAEAATDGGRPPDEAASGSARTATGNGPSSEYTS